MINSLHSHLLEPEDWPLSEWPTGVLNTAIKKIVGMNPSLCFCSDTLPPTIMSEKHRGFQIQSFLALISIFRQNQK